MRGRGAWAQSGVRFRTGWPCCRVARRPHQPNPCGFSATETGLSGEVAALASPIRSKT